MIEMYKILTGKYDVDVTPKVFRVYGSTTQGRRKGPKTSSAHSPPLPPPLPLEVGPVPFP